VIPADILSSDPTGNLQDLRRILKGSGNPPNLHPGDALRPALQQIEPFGATQPGGLRLGDIRGHLIVSHGALRLFFPYFPAVGDNIDPRLVESLAMLGSGPQVDAQVAFRAARRFSEATRDGHYFWSSQYAPARDFILGPLPVVLQQVSGEPVVRKSNTSLVQPGDTLTSIAGLSAADWFAQEYPFISAATDGYRFIRAYQQGGIWRLTGPTEFGIRAPDGSTRTVTYNPTFETPVPQRDFSSRSEGPLSDMGAPDLYYINPAAAVIGSDLARFNAAVDQAKSLGSAGMIIDNRNSKGLNHRLILQRLICSPSSSMIYNIPVLSGPDVRTIYSTQVPVNSVDPYCGPMVLLVDTQNISSEEDFAGHLVGAHRVIVVGRRTAGTNGNIAALFTPGGGLFPFTGLEVRNVDGSQFHGIGIVPDFPVQYTAADFAAGRDRDLEVAIQVLHGQTP
jgi:peptidase S41-like protein